MDIVEGRTDAGKEQALRLLDIAVAEAEGRLMAREPGPGGTKVPAWPIKYEEISPGQWVGSVAGQQFRLQKRTGGDGLRSGFTLTIINPRDPQGEPLGLVSAIAYPLAPENNSETANKMLQLACHATKVALRTTAEDVVDRIREGVEF